jgi:hypothetical protein
MIKGNITVGKTIKVMTDDGVCDILNPNAYPLKHKKQVIGHMIGDKFWINSVFGVQYGKSNYDIYRYIEDVVINTMNNISSFAMINIDKKINRRDLYRLKRNKEYVVGRFLCMYIISIFKHNLSDGDIAGLYKKSRVMMFHSRKLILDVLGGFYGSVDRDVLFHMIGNVQSYLINGAYMAKVFTQEDVLKILNNVGIVKEKVDKVKLELIRY